MAARHRLGPDVILGHAIIVAPGSWTNWSRTTSASWRNRTTWPMPCGFSPGGASPLESLARYLARVNMTLGTDTSPQSMIEGMRYTAVVGKIVDRQTEVATAADVFNAATPGGPRHSAAMISGASNRAPRRTSFSGGATPSSRAASRPDPKYRLLRDR